jgi:hypothetical protein
MNLHGDDVQPELGVRDMEVAFPCNRSKQAVFRT